MIERAWIPALGLLVAVSCYDKGAGVHLLRTRAASGMGSVAQGGGGPASRPASQPASRPAPPASKAPPTQKPGSKPPEKVQASPKGRIPSTRSLEPVLSKILHGARVDYDEVARHRPVLDAYLAKVAKADLGKASLHEKLAFYINAYNVSVLTQVLDRISGKAPKGRDYKGVLAVKGFFDNKSVRASGEFLSLNELEAKGRALGDPRIHFAVNCASISCPALLDRPWKASTLDKDLTDATRRHFATKEGLVLEDGIVKVTQLLNWYSKDFGGKEGARRFALKYAPALARQALARGIDGFLTYNWNLNKN